MSSRLVSPAAQPTQQAAPAEHTDNTALEGSATASRVWDYVFFALAVLMGLLLFVRQFYIYFEPDQYVYLARAFAAGRLDIDHVQGRVIDSVIWNGHHYLAYGPLPALLLVPFLPLFDLGVDVGAVSLLLTVLNVWLLYRSLALLGINGERRKWAVLLLFAGTHLYATILVPVSTWFAHVVVVTFALLAIRETLDQRRVFLIGLFVGLAATTRLTAVFALPFFLWLLWHERLPEDTKLYLSMRLRRFAGLAAGLAGPIALLFLYNYVRFGNPLESGYNLAALGSDTLSQARAQGLFSLVHVPKNLFMLLLQGPLPYPSVDAPTLEFPYLQFSRWGLGLFFVAPALLLAFRAPLKNRVVQACWLATLCVLVPLLTYYGVGWYQFGFRYALDFLPFFALIAMIGFLATKLNAVRILVTASVLVNLWGALWLITWM